MQIHRFLENKRYLFWALQCAGWSSWAITFYLGMLVWGKPMGTYAIYLPIVSTVGMLITLVLRALYRATWNKDIGWRVVAILVGSYLAGAVWMASRVVTFRTLFPESIHRIKSPEMEFWSYFDGTTSAFMVMFDTISSCFRCFVHLRSPRFGNRLPQGPPARPARSGGV